MLSAMAHLAQLEDVLLWMTNSWHVTVFFVGYSKLMDFHIKNRMRNSGFLATSVVSSYKNPHLHLGPPQEMSDNREVFGKSFRKQNRLITRTKKKHILESWLLSHEFLSINLHKRLKIHVRFTPTSRLKAASRVLSASSPVIARKPSLQRIGCLAVSRTGCIYVCV